MSQSHSAIPICDFSISAEISSGPLALPFFSLRTAFRTSSNRIGPRSISRLSDASTMLNTELPLVVVGFNRCLNCSVQRFNLSSFVFRGSPVVETSLLIWGLHFWHNCFDPPNTSFRSPLSEWSCIVSPMSFSHCLLSDLKAFRTSLQQLENISSASALLCFLNCNSARFLIKASVSTVI